MNLATEFCPDSEFSPKFIQGMINRVAVSFHKYGKWEDNCRKTCFLASMHQRVEKYRETGNTEFLIDAANFLMGEFMHPQQQGAYFQGTDSDASPGLIALDGRKIAHPSQA